MKKKPSLLERRAAAAHATAKAKCETSGDSARGKNVSVSTFSFQKMSLPSQAKASAFKQSPIGRRIGDRLSNLIQSSDPVDDLQSGLYDITPPSISSSLGSKFKTPDKRSATTCSEINDDVACNDT